MMKLTESVSDVLVTAGQRDPDNRSLWVIATMPGGEEFKLAIWPPKWRKEPERFARELAATYRGIGPRERLDVIEQVRRICKENELDIELYPPHAGKINGKATTSIEFYWDGKLAVQDSGNLFSTRTQKDWAVRIAQIAAGDEPTPLRLKNLTNRIESYILERSRGVRKLMQTPKARGATEERCPYRVEGHRIVMYTEKGEIVLSNFAARIVAVVTRNDGLETESSFALECITSGDVRRTIHVKTKKFNEMNWPIEYLDVDGFINPDRNAVSHVRAAIGHFSRDPKPERKMIYTHTGWLKLGESHVYLHGGGAISAEAEPPKIEVALHKALQRYVLPDPYSGVALKTAFRASLKLLELGPARVAFPGYCAIWRSVLGACDCGVFTVGPSGAFKSELTALRLQHFGAGLDRTHMPANFSSTPNALELVAFAAKDTILGIDDFAPAGSRNQIDALHGTAERIFRAQGNQSGRQRSSKDAQVDEAKPPRGLIIASGEDVPRGKSLRARLMIEEVAPGDIPPAKLSICQRDAREGLYAGFTAAYVRWLCKDNRIAEIQKNLRGKIDELRERAVTSGVHRRTPEVVANLLIGLMYFLEFSIESELITKSEGDQLWARAWAAMGEAAQQQAALQADNDPAHRFIELLSSALLSGELHLTNAAGDAPDHAIAAACGWFKRTETSTVWESRGLWGGCVDGDEVFLEFDTAVRAVQRAGGADGVVIAAATLRKRLHEQGFIQSAANGEGRLSVRKRVKGALRMMVWLSPRATGGLFARTARTARTEQDDFPFGDAPEGQDA